MSDSKRDHLTHVAVRPFVSASSGPRQRRDVAVCHAKVIAFLFAGAVGVGLPQVVLGQAAPDWGLSGAATATLAVGASSDFLDSGFGVDVSLSRRLSGGLSLRADVMLIDLEAHRGPSEVASNALLVLGVGPEASVELPGVGLYLRGVVGIAGSRQTRRNSASPERTSWTEAVGAGAGLRLGIGSRMRLDVGADILRSGELDFARAVATDPVVTESATYLRLKVGLGVSLGG